MNESKDKLNDVGHRRVYMPTRDDVQATATSVQDFPQQHSNGYIKFSGSYRYMTFNQCGWKRCTSTAAPAVKQLQALALMLMVLCALRRPDLPERGRP